MGGGHAKRYRLSGSRMRNEKKRLKMGQRREKISKDQQILLEYSLEKGIKLETIRFRLISMQICV